jgi:hypothetical protein
LIKPGEPGAKQKITLFMMLQQKTENQKNHQRLNESVLAYVGIGFEIYKSLNHKIGERLPIQPAYSQNLGIV